MKLLYVVHRFPVLSQTFIREEIIRQVNSGMQVRVLTLSPIVMRTAEEALALPMPVSSRLRYARLRNFLQHLPNNQQRLLLIGKLGVAYLRLCWRLPGVGRWQPDIIHAHFGDSGLVAAKLKGWPFCKARLFVTFHGYDIGRLMQGKNVNFYRRLFQDADKLLAVNEVFCRRLVEAGGEPTKVLLHHVGVDTSQLCAHPIALPRDDSTLQVTSVGRLVKKKGHRVLIEAVAVIVRNYPELNVKVEIIGNGTEYPLLQRHIAAHGLQSNVTLVGDLPHAQVLERLRQCDIYVQPSRTDDNGDCEGIPVALMEAMACGRPVIGTRHSGIPELIEDGVSGLLVDVDNPEQMAHAISSLAKRKSEWLGMGQAGRRKVQESFDAAKQLETLQALYRNQ